MAELADAQDLGSCRLIPVRVRIPSLAPTYDNFPNGKTFGDFSSDFFIEKFLCKSGKTCRHKKSPDHEGRGFNVTISRTRNPLPGDLREHVLSGVENRTKVIDDLVESGVIRRVLAQVEIACSNSLIEAWWRSLKHQWLFLNSLESVAAVEKLTAFYVREHNAELPHSAFRGQTPDEMYFGTGEGVPDDLKARRREARAKRMETNRARSCRVCRESTSS